MRCARRPRLFPCRPEIRCRSAVPQIRFEHVVRGKRGCAGRLTENLGLSINPPQKFEARQPTVDVPSPEAPARRAPKGRRVMNRLLKAALAIGRELVATVANSVRLRWAAVESAIRARTRRAAVEQSSHHRSRADLRPER